MARSVGDLEDRPMTKQYARINAAAPPSWHAKAVLKRTINFDSITKVQTGPHWTGDLPTVNVDATLRVVY